MFLSVRRRSFPYAFCVQIRLSYEMIFSYENKLHIKNSKQYVVQIMRSGWWLYPKVPCNTNRYGFPLAHENSVDIANYCGFTVCLNKVYSLRVLELPNCMFLKHELAASQHGQSVNTILFDTRWFLEVRA